MSEILIRHPTNLREHSGEFSAVDSYNVMYQFLSSIRQPDGTPLLDSRGNVTSHLSGIFYRTVNLIEAGMQLIFVMDGKPSHLKGRELEARRLQREKNLVELEKAIELEDTERIRSLSSRINRISKEMVDESAELLQAMGVPVVFAPSEGEAQCAYLSSTGVVRSVITQDYDALLFGARRVLRNFTFSGKRKIPGRNMYINVSPEYIDLDENLQSLGITREQLIAIGIMVGTDFNEGVPRVGAKTALNLVRKHGDLKHALEAKGASFEDVAEVFDLFMNPPHRDDVIIARTPPDRARIEEILCSRHDFSPDRVSPYIDTLERIWGQNAQSSLDSFF
ncbi:flap endonuclease-1 [Thermoplasmatales archaeon AK]|nr:flap endonuclease-1 [Thermoplasmatales archaeon AK]